MFSLNHKFWRQEIGQFLKLNANVYSISVMLSCLSYWRFSSSNLLKCKAGLLCRESALFHYTYTKSYQINFAPLHGLLKSKSKSKIGIADPVEEIYHQGQLDQKTRCHDCLCAGRAWYGYTTKAGRSLLQVFFFFFQNCVTKQNHLLKSNQFRRCRSRRAVVELVHNLYLIQQHTFPRLMSLSKELYCRSRDDLVQYSISNLNFRHFCIVF